MSVTPSTLSAIQQAGQAIDLARQSLADAVKDHAQRVMAAVADQPFNLDNDKLFTHWKTLARLAQEVHSIEEQFKTIYQTTSSLMAPETPVLKALPQAGQRKTPGQPDTYALDTSGAEDVQVKPGPAKKKTRKARRRATAPATRKASAAADSPGRALGGNDAKVFEHLKTALNKKTWTRLTHSAVAQGSAIPLGSVGLALRRLLASGRIVEGQTGLYRLA